jgi:CBS domain-containing protein
MLARDLMTRNVASCTPDTSLRAAAQLMRDEDCGCLPVKAGEHQSALLGLITDRDLVCRAVANDLNPTITPVSRIMSSPVETIHENATEEACIQRMADKQVRRLAVVDSQGRCCGIISQGDIARRLPSDKTGSLVKEVSQPDKGGQPQQAMGRVAASGTARGTTGH